VALFQLDRFEESETAFQRALAIEPSATTYANLGTLYYAQRRFPEALDAFERASHLRPADARIWGHLGAASRRVPGMEERSRQGYERAIGLMRERLERDPDDGGSWSMYGGWLAVQGRHEEARAAIGQALRLSPHNLRCHVEAACAFLLFGEHETALDHVERALVGGYGIRELESGIDFEPLHAHERFIRLLSEARARRDSMASVRVNAG
jgi:serine/threonine-protein kinase